MSATAYRLIANPLLCDWPRPTSDATGDQRRSIYRRSQRRLDDDNASRGCHDRAL
jgi:hypothetical protein